MITKPACHDGFEGKDRSERLQYFSKCSDAELRVVVVVLERSSGRKKFGVFPIAGKVHVLHSPLGPLQPTGAVHGERRPPLTVSVRWSGSVGGGLTAK